MRQVQVTTEAGVTILLAVFILAIVIIAVQQNKITKNINEINASMGAIQEALNESS